MEKFKKFEEFINENLNENKNPEGDAKVLSFMKRLAKDWDLPMAQVAVFIKASIKRNGY